jgi:multidrug efflux pump subunit AcrA (membrane-fusion protein)
VPENPGKSYAATVESSSRSVDAASGAMLVQLIVDNKDAALMPGGFANVSLNLPKTVASFGIPSSALIFGQAGLRVATVEADGKAKLKLVTIARDLGKTVELSSGIAATDRVIENPPDGIVDGQVVHVAETGQTEKPAAAGKTAER